METLSAEAADLLQRRLGREWVEVDDQTRPLYRELVDAGLMIPLHTFSLGPNSAYRLTDLAITRDVNGRATPVPSAGASPSPRS